MKYKSVGTGESNERIRKKETIRIVEEDQELQNADQYSHPRRFVMTVA